jgi:hypothetical protein
MALLDDVKMSLRVSTNAYDSELTDLIESAKLDLGLAGVIIPENINAICSTAIKTYCKIHFGTPDDKTQAYLKQAYDEQKAQLSMATGYTDFSMVENA